MMILLRNTGRRPTPEADLMILKFSNSLRWSLSANLRSMEEAVGPVSMRAIAFSDLGLWRMVTSSVKPMTGLDSMSGMSFFVLYKAFEKDF